MIRQWWRRMLKLEQIDEARIDAYSGVNQLRAELRRERREQSGDRRTGQDRRANG